MGKWMAARGMICLMLLAYSSPASSEWKQILQKDELTGKTLTMFSSQGRPALQQFGRSVEVRLVLACTDLYNGAKQYENEQFISATLWFTEGVGLASTTLRYTIDNSDPQIWTTTPASRGQQIDLSTIPQFDHFVVPLSTSNMVKVQVDLPWAGRRVVSFNTSGALEGINRIPCHDRRFRTR